MALALVAETADVLDERWRVSHRVTGDEAPVDSQADVLVGRFGFDRLVGRQVDPVVQAWSGAHGVRVVLDVRWSRQTPPEPPARS